MKNEKGGKKEEGKEEVILAQLELLANMRKLHEWTVIGQKEADYAEDSESKKESADSYSADESSGEE